MVKRGITAALLSSPTLAFAADQTSQAPMLVLGSGLAIIGLGLILVVTRSRKTVSIKDAPSAVPANSAATASDQATSAMRMKLRDLERRLSVLEEAYQDSPIVSSAAAMSQIERSRLEADLADLEARKAEQIAAMEQRKREFKLAAENLVGNISQFLSDLEATAESATHPRASLFDLLGDEDVNSDLSVNQRRVQPAKRKAA